jgi:tetratricopeptide (TPR) repeat protein
MVALNLRQGTPGAAVVALEKADLDRALPPGLQELIEDAERRNDPDAWLELFRQVESMRGQESSETSLPRYLPDAAALWAALSLYRSAPGKVESAMPLAMTLVEFGMPEVASTLLSQNSDEKTSEEALNWSLALVLRGLLELSHTDQLKAARRSYQEAGSLFRLADGGRDSGPASARAQSLMAALEARHGYAQRALTLLQSAVGFERHPESMLRLAQLQSQQNQPEKAITTIRKAIELAQSSGNLLLESRGEEALFRAHREVGQDDAAEQALSRALARILVLRQMEVATVDTATIERQLARVLQYYGRDREMRDAYFRALDASRSSALELEITLTDMSRAALTTSDVKLGRRATQTVLDMGLPAENSIYIALWQKLLEQRSGSSTDGMSREVLARANKAEGWLDTLRKFGLGEIQAGDLGSEARGIPQQVEADFYAALSAGKVEALKKIAESSAVDLIEVRIAQDLVAPQKPFSLPDGVELP